MQCRLIIVSYLFLLLIIIICGKLQIPPSTRIFKEIVKSKETSLVALITFDPKPEIKKGIFQLLEAVEKRIPSVQPILVDVVLRCQDFQEEYKYIFEKQDEGNLWSPYNETSGPLFLLFRYDHGKIYDGPYQYAKMVQYLNRNDMLRELKFPSEKTKLLYSTDVNIIFYSEDVSMVEKFKRIAWILQDDCYFAYYGVKMARKLLKQTGKPYLMENEMILNSIFNSTSATVGNSIRKQLMVNGTSEDLTVEGIRSLLDTMKNSRRIQRIRTIMLDHLLKKFDSLLIFFVSSFEGKNRKLLLSLDSLAQKIANGFQSNNSSSALETNEGLDNQTVISVSPLSAISSTQCGSSDEQLSGVDSGQCIMKTTSSSSEIIQEVLKEDKVFGIFYSDMYNLFDRLKDFHVDWIDFPTAVILSRKLKYALALDKKEYDIFQEQSLLTWWQKYQRGELGVYVKSERETFTLQGGGSFLWKLTRNLFEKEVLQMNRSIIIDFWEPSCPYCVALEPVMEELAKELYENHKENSVKQQQQQTVIIAKYNILLNEIPKQVEVRFLPTLIMYTNCYSPLSASKDITTNKSENSKVSYDTYIMFKGEKTKEKIRQWITENMCAN